MALNKFIKCATLAGFNAGKTNGQITDSCIAFIEETKQIWTHGVFYSCPYTKEEIDAIIADVEANEGAIQGAVDRITAIENSKGAKNGIATLDANGLVPVSQLPSAISDVIEGTWVSASVFNGTDGNPVAGQSGKIYVDTTSGLLYRYSGSAFVEISSSLQLGETATTAYAGDKGAQLRTDVDNHIADKNNPHGVTAAQLNIDDSLLNKTSEDILDELTSAQVTTALGYTPPTQDTTYELANADSNGLMSAAHFTKLEGIEAGAQVNTITGIKGEAESEYRVGQVNITKANVGLGNVTNESKEVMFTSPEFTGTPVAPTAAAGDDSTQIATTAFVQKEISDKLAAADAMIFKGTVSSDADLPAAHTLGWTYKVAVAGTYAGQACEVGDMIICIADGTVASNSDWTVVQNNIDGAVTGPVSAIDAQIAVFDGASGKIIKDGGISIAALKEEVLNPDNLSKVVPVSKGGTGADNAVDALKNLGLTATAEELNYTAGVISGIQGQLNNKSDNDHTHLYAGSESVGGPANSVKSNLVLKVNSGSVEGTSLYTFNGSEAKSLDVKAGNNVTLTAAAGSVTIAAQDTLNTAGSTEGNAKLFLIGATEQAASAQTYSRSKVYIDANGNLYSNDTKVSVEGHNHDDAYLKLSGGTLTGSVEATNFVKTGGTKDQILMADGSVTNTSAYWSGEWVELD